MTGILRYRYHIVLAILVVANLFIWALVYKNESGVLTVAFLNIGQGDAIYIETPHGNQMLVDGGPDRSVLALLGKQMSFWDRSIDVVLATHPDKDHIGGLPDVLRRFRVGYIVDPGLEGTTGTFAAFRTYSNEEHATRVTARRGQRIVLDQDISFDILYPDRDVTDFESNTASIVGVLHYGNESFLLTGDSPQKIERYLVALDPNALDVDVLKLGHHGSRTSTSREFLFAASPQYAIVSAGKDNRYGHPHKEVVDLVHEQGATILSTIDKGTIVFKTDGSRLWVK